MGVTAAKDGLADAKLITSGPQARMCLDVVSYVPLLLLLVDFAAHSSSVLSRLVSVSEHLFPREYEWVVWLVDAPGVANACCYPGGKEDRAVKTENSN